MKKNITVSSSEKLALIDNIATMLTAGIPILDTATSMLEDQKGNLKTILETLRDDLSEGKTISFSFEKFPKIFDPVTISLLKAAEEAGTLSETLKDITESTKKDMEFSDKIKSALVYPVLVMVVFTFVLIVILVFVIPRVATVFDRLRLNLPLPTKILIVSSKLFLAYTPYVISAAVLIGLIIVFLYRTKRQVLFGFFFRLPLLSRLSKEIDLTRFTRSLSLLLTGGIPITEALDLCVNVVARVELKQTIKETSELVSSGKKLSDGLKKTKRMIPGIMVRITEAGEKSGTLEKSMQELSEHFDNQASTTLKNLTNLFEPVLLVVIGVLVGGVMLAIVAPIYGLISQISGK